MKKLIYICLLLPFAFCGFSCSKSEKSDFVFEPEVPLGDPFILLYEGTYYAYGTNADNGIEVYTSDDLLYWSKSNKLALISEDSWGGRWFWAPEVYYMQEKKKFYMYYSANEHICVATSDSPLGPFVQDPKVPMLESESAIDNSLFIDDDGKAYLYFVRFNSVSGSGVWSAQLGNDLKTMDQGTLKQHISVSQEWERVWGLVNEGPFVIKHNNLYYMTYSANSYESQRYGIGLATASSPEGPWTKYTGNPILQLPADLVGVGHNALFHDKDGKLKIVFHAHHSKDSIHPRAMYIADVTWTTDALPVMKISSDIIRPKIKRK